MEGSVKAVKLGLSLSCGEGKSTGNMNFSPRTEDYLALIFRRLKIVLSFSKTAVVTFNIVRL